MPDQSHQKSALTLFDGYDPPAEPAEQLSADRRRTLRQHTDIANGIHPLTRRAVHDDDRRTCGNCRHRRNNAWQYPKCWAHDGARATHSASSDVRAFWPGCHDHEWGAPALSPDAARWVPDA